MLKEKKKEREGCSPHPRTSAVSSDMPREFFSSHFFFRRMGPLLLQSLEVSVIMVLTSLYTSIVYFAAGYCCIFLFYSFFLKDFKLHTLQLKRVSYINYLHLSLFSFTSKFMFMKLFAVFYNEIQQIYSNSLKFIFLQNEIRPRREKFQSHRMKKYWHYIYDCAKDQFNSISATYNLWLYPHYDSILKVRKSITRAQK